MTEVVTIGETMVLLMANDGRPLRSARSFTRSVAGSESNVAIGLARLGHRSGWIGRVGDDPFGHSVLDALRGEGVDVSRAVVDADAPTGVLIRDQHPERRIRVLYYRNQSAGSRLSTDDIDADYIGGARVVHLSGITLGLSPESRDAVAYAAATARERGVAVSFDPNLRLRLWPAAQAAAAMVPIVAQSDIVQVGLEEGQLLTGRSGQDAVASWFLEHGAGLVTVKRGANGSWATDGRTTWESEPFRVQTVDPVGAGDAFVAGFLAAWLRDADVAESLRQGNAVGAMAVQLSGDVEGLPYCSDVKGLVDPDGDVDR